ncbi:MAG: hypothetical protein R2883_02730 [Caldisericia bacterium]
MLMEAGKKLFTKGPSDEIEITEILDGNTVYMFDPYFDGWMKTNNRRYPE